MNNDTRNNAQTNHENYTSGESNTDANTKSMSIKAKINNLRKNKVLTFATKVAFILTALLTVYYAFAIRPKMQIPGKTRVLRNSIGIHKVNLLQNRLTFLDVVNKRAWTPGEEFNLISNIQSANLEGLEEIYKQIELPNVPQVDDKEISKLIEDTRKFYQEQQETIEILSAYLDVIDKLAVYNASIDFGLLDIDNDKELLSERAMRARVALSKISGSLEELGVETNESIKLELSIKDTNIMLSEMLRALDIGEAGDAEKIRSETIDKFEQLRADAYIAFVSIVKSPETVLMLTKHTNLIHRFDYYLEQLE